MHLHIKSICLVMGLTAVAALPGLALADDRNPPVQGDEFYCQERGLGPNFYCVAPEPEPEPEAKPSAPAPVETTPEKDADIAGLEAFQIILDDSRKKAVWNPTPENVRSFMENQIIMAERADKFSNVFTRLGWQNPELSYNVENPVNRAALQTYRMTERASRVSHMGSISERYGIYYFYSQNCAACRVFSPILDGFRRIHDIKVVAVSMDGGPNAVFGDWRPNNGIARGLGLENTVTPAVILFDARTSETIPVSFGAISIEELEDRIYDLTGGQNNAYIGEPQ